jgi:hypothetical protein
LIVDAIDLDVWIFTPAPRWTPTVVFCDNDLEYGWSRDRENDGNTRDVMSFRYVQISQRIITLRPCVLVLLMTISVVVHVVDLLDRVI